MWWYGDHLGGLGQFHGLAVVGFVLMIVLWAAIIVAIAIGVRALILAGRRRSGGPPPFPGPTPPTPGNTMPARESERSEALRILDERYARGEIDRENYLRTKTDLTGRIEASGTGQGAVA